MTHWRDCKTVEENREFLKETVKECCPSAGDHDNDVGFRIAVVLIAALVKGTNIDNLTALTGYPPEFVAAISFAAGHAGLWADGRYCYENWFVGESVKPVAILLDVMVIEGLLIRQKCEDGQIRYKSLRPC